MYHTAIWIYKSKVGWNVFSQYEVMTGGKWLLQGQLNCLLVERTTGMNRPIRGSHTINISALKCINNPLKLSTHFIMECVFIWIIHIFNDHFSATVRVCFVCMERMVCYEKLKMLSCFYPLCFTSKWTLRWMRMAPWTLAWRNPSNERASCLDPALGFGPQILLPLPHSIMVEAVAWHHSTYTLTNRRSGRDHWITPNQTAKERRKLMRCDFLSCLSQDIQVIQHK